MYLIRLHAEGDSRHQRGPPPIASDTPRAPLFVSLLPCSSSSSFRRTSEQHPNLHTARKPSSYSSPWSWRSCPLWEDASPSSRRCTTTTACTRVTKHCWTFSKGKCRLMCPRPAQRAGHAPVQVTLTVHAELTCAVPPPARTDSRRTWKSASRGSSIAKSC